MPTKITVAVPREGHEDTFKFDAEFDVIPRKGDLVPFSYDGKTQVGMVDSFVHNRREDGSYAAVLILAKPSD